MRKPGRRTPNPSRVSVFEVRLQCEAAPEIGCGLKAKPLLQDLERLPGIEQAWLNRTGNRLAIVKVAQFDEAGDESLGEVSRKHRIALRPLGSDVPMAVDHLADSSLWYRADDVDQLSSEEARVIAMRLVKRLRHRVQLNDSQEKKLVRSMEVACANQLIRNPTQSAVDRKRRIAQAVLKVANEHLKGAELAVFAEVAQRGHRPLPGEQ